MARKRSSRSQAGSSSPNTVLVVFLVLFILATLGLGGWVYSIFGERHKWESQAKEAVNKEKSAKKAEDWALLQAYELKNMLGDPSLQDDKGADFERWKNLHDDVFSEEGGQFKLKEGNKFDAEPDKDAFFKLVDNGRKYLGWNPQTHRYTKTYQGKIKEAVDDAATQRAGRYTEHMKQVAQEEKGRSLQKAFGRPGVEPREAPPEQFQFQAPLPQIVVVEIGNLEFAARRGLERGGDCGDLFIVEIETGNGIVGWRYRRLLDDLSHRAVRGEVDHAVLAGLAHPMPEHDSAGFFSDRPPQCRDEVVPVKNVVTEHQRRSAAGNEGAADQKRLSQPVGIRLGLRN